MHHAGFEACGVKLLHHLLESVVLLLGVSRIHGAGEVGVDPRQRQTRAVGIQAVDLLDLLRQETKAPHAGVDLHMGLRHGRALPCHPIQGLPLLQRGDGQDRPQIHQLIKLRLVGGSFHHQDGVFLKSRFSQAAHF